MKKNTNKKNAYSLAGTTVLVTGSAGQIGREIVIRLLENGAFVYSADSQTLPASLEKKIRGAYLRRHTFVPMDVTLEKSIRAAKKAIKRPIDVLINCAGVGVYTPFEARIPEDMDRVYQVNLRGTILCSQIFSSDMAKRKKGRIINFGSIYGVTTPDFKIYGKSGRNSSEIYGATKAGIIHVTKYLAAYLAKHNILVNSISPGGVFNNQHPYFVKRYEAKTPLGRMATPRDLTGIIAFLCSDDASYMTGQNITVDGGFTVW